MLLSSLVYLELDRQIPVIHFCLLVNILTMMKNAAILVTFLSSVAAFAPAQNGGMYAVFPFSFAFIPPNH